MPIIDPEASRELQSELLSGETLIWAGRPNFSVIFHSDDWIMIPFSLMWGGFSIFWEVGALGLWGAGSRGTPTFDFMALWGIPFIVIGQYMIWGRFLYDAWLKRGTYYGLTNRRALLLQDRWSRKTCSIYLEAIPSIVRECSAIGTIWFGPRFPVMAGRGQKTRSLSRFTVSDTPVFADIDDPDAVYQMATDLKESVLKSPFQS
jgi:hypothetical protein